MTIEEISKLTSDLLACREKTNAAYTDYQSLALARDAKQAELLAAFKQSEIKSIKKDDATVSLSSRKTLSIVDETKLIKWLKSQKMASEYVETRVNQVFKVSAAPALARQGKIPTGTELVETEFISVRKTQKAE